MKDRFRQVQLFCVFLIALIFAASAFPCRQLSADSDTQETDQSYLSETNELETIESTESTESTEETMVTDMSEPLSSSESVEQTDLSDSIPEATESELGSSTTVESITEPLETNSLIEDNNATPTDKPEATPVSTPTPEDNENYDVFSQGEVEVFGFQNPFAASDWTLYGDVTLSDYVMKLNNSISADSSTTYNGYRSFSPDYSLSGRLTFVVLSANSFYESKNVLEYCIFSSDEGLTGPSISILFDPIDGKISLLSNRDRNNPIATESYTDLKKEGYRDLWYNYDGQTHIFKVFDGVKSILTYEIDLSEVFNGCKSFSWILEWHDWPRSSLALIGVELDPFPSMNHRSFDGFALAENTGDKLPDNLIDYIRSFNDRTSIDKVGQDIIMHYFYGKGEAITVSNDSYYTEYMERNFYLRDEVKEVVFSEANGIEIGEIRNIDINVQMDMGPWGENAHLRGVTLLRTTDSTVGDFNIRGTITRFDNGDIEYNMTYTWNDIITYDDRYDCIPDNVLENVFGDTMSDYTIRISWSDVSVIGNNSSGWLSKD